MKNATWDEVLIIAMCLIAVGASGFAAGGYLAPVKTVEVYGEMPYAADTPEKRENDWVIIRYGYRDFRGGTIPDEPPPVGSDFIYDEKEWKITKIYYGERGFKWIKLERERP